ncbi:hypothetical protein PENSPDRAFT_690166 [Peniophora sp. CONT]|nr:hypothetical protein PENSPDRAFT_690166 [Peniophora sp. CONT]
MNDNVPTLMSDLQVIVTAFCVLACVLAVLLLLAYGLLVLSKRLLLRPIYAGAKIISRIYHYILDCVGYDSTRSEIVLPRAQHPHEPPLQLNVNSQPRFITAGNAAHTDPPKIIVVDATHNRGTQSPRIAPCPTVASTAQLKQETGVMEYQQDNHLPVKHKSANLKMVFALGDPRYHPVNYYQSSGPAQLSPPDFLSTNARIGDVYINHVSNGSAQIWYWEAIDAKFRWTAVMNDMQALPDVGPDFAGTTSRYVLNVRKKDGFATWILRKTALEYRAKARRQLADLAAAFMMGVAACWHIVGQAVPTAQQSGETGR